MQYTEFFFSCKIRKFHWKNVDIFNVSAQNIDLGYTLEPPQRGSSNEYPQSMFWINNKKIDTSQKVAEFNYPNNMSPDARKPVFGVSDHVCSKPVCTVREEG